MADAQNHMAKEIAEIPSSVQYQIDNGLDLYVSEGRRVAELNPPFLTTCARGSSDYAAMFLKYLVEIGLGLPVASIGPSIASIYESNLRLDLSVSVAISQSGASPDIVKLQEFAGQGGARTISVLNTPESPVGNASMSVLPVFAGPEHAVAATKSFVGSLVAVCGLFAGLSGDREIEAALRDLPSRLSTALECDWSSTVDPVAQSHSLYTIGRGSTLAIAGEAALKLKETCLIHAEAFSAAEVRHGPIALARQGFTSLAFVPEDRAKQSVLGIANEIAALGAKAICVGGGDLSGVGTWRDPPPHPALVPICQITAFYVFAEKLSRRLERDKMPSVLSKITKTV
ncbi:MAG: SIS domain-containing protein [Albidovulum sp.]|nr:SIS domain-containing protein [Albidovulum sp.]MDE0532033.1 SIS domain-containing protein [Albidovulum sp.]